MKSSHFDIGSVFVVVSAVLRGSGHSLDLFSFNSEEPNIMIIQDFRVLKRGEPRSKRFDAFCKQLIAMKVLEIVTSFVQKLLLWRLT